MQSTIRLLSPILIISLSIMGSFSPIFWSEASAAPTLQYKTSYESRSINADVGSNTPETTVPGGRSGGTITVVANPHKDAINGSDWVGRHFVPAGYARAELSSQYIPVNETTKTYNVMYYIPSDFSSGSQSWNLISQFKTYPCGTGPAGPGQICQTGPDDGIFDEIRVDQNPWRLTFRHRTQPDCSYSDVSINPDEWVALTFQIKWTKTPGAGFIKIWKNGVLVFDRQGIKTMFDSNTCNMYWANGLYGGFSSGGHQVYADNVEIWDGLKDPVTTPAPVVSLSPTTMGFGSVAVGASSAVNYVKVTNTGNSTLIFNGNFGLTGDFRFGGLGNCGPTVAPGANCRISLKFNPTVAGTRTGTLTINDNAVGPHTVLLSGIGTSRFRTTTSSPHTMRPGT